jgi:hypothetical protein
MDGNQFGKLIEDQSGRDGIEKINDFGDWYNQNYPDNESALDEKSRMVLVGLGVDNRTRRMVNFLTDSGVDIQLLTFHAFEKDGQIFIARQIEIMSPTGRGTGRRGSHRSTRETNLQTLQKEAASLGAEIFLDEVAGFLNDLLPAYQWPGTTSYSYSLTERTDQGRASLRVYVALRLNYKEPGALHIVLPERAIEAAGSQLKTFREKFNKEIRYDGRYKDMHIQITGQNWSSIKSELEPVLTDMVAGWKAKTRAEDQIHGSEGVQTIE